MGRKDVALFALSAAAIYLLLVIPWPGARAQYAGFFRAFGNAVFAVRRDAVRFEPVATPGYLDTDVAVRHSGTRGAAHLRLESRTLGWLPMAFLAALVLATPAPRRRRVAALGLGLAAMHVFLALRLAIPIELAAADLRGSEPDVFLAALEPILAHRLAAGFVLATLCWVALLPWMRPEIRRQLQRDLRPPKRS